MSRKIVTTLSDFGLRDGYVAAMKGRLLSGSTPLALVDISHEVPPGSVATAAWLLHQAAPWFPAGTVHLCVVDPGVGGARRALACAIGSQLYVAPDNGLLTLMLAGAEVRAHGVDAARFGAAPHSPVFHGRDLFAPAAAHLAAGGPLEALGEAVDPASLVRLAWPQPEERGGIWRGSVVHVDHFGSLVTNVPLAPGAAGAVEILARTLDLVRTYSDVAEGELLALCGSSGVLEVARRGGSAAEALGAAPGVVVEFRPVER